MKCLAYFSIICLLEFTRLSHGSNCSVGWLEYKNCCYFFHNVTKGLPGQYWADAHMSCQRYTGNLLSIADSEEDAFVHEQLKSDGNQYWIGLNDIQNNGTYEWSDNESLLFSKSKAGSLGNQENMDCVEITSDIWSNNFCNLLLGFICKVKTAHIERQTTYIGGIYSIETIDPQNRIDIPLGYGDHAGVVKNSMERFFIVEALNGKNDSVSFQSATNMYRFIRTEGILKIQSPIPRSMCTTYSQYANDASFIVVDNMFFPGYVSFKKKDVYGFANQLLRNDNNTFIYLQPLQDLDLYRREASFRFVKLGVCNYTTWSDWGDCSATCHNGNCGNPVKIRKRICQADTLGGEVYDFQSCNYHEPCPGSLTQWSSWEVCSASCKSLVNGPYQYRIRSCFNFFSYDPYYIGCFNSSLEDQQLCNQNISCQGSLSPWSSWGTCSASCKSLVNGPYQYRNRSCVDFFSFDPNYIGCFNSSLNDQQLCFCLEQTVGDEYSGVYTFPNTSVSQLVTKSCVYNTSMISSRQCVWNYIFGIPEWKPDVFSILDLCPFKSGTSKQLQEIILLERVTVTKENVVNVTDELNLIISNGSLTRISEISRVSNILKNVINVNSSSNLVTNGILLIVDNLISINRDLIKHANQVSNLSAVFLSQLDDLADQQTSNTTITMKNFAFTSYTSLVNEKTIYIYSQEMEESRISVNIASDVARDEYRDAKDYIILPLQLFSDQSKIKVYSYIFWDKTFFEKRNETIGSVILSATISGVSIANNSMANSINPIKMKFSSNTRMSGYRTCRFYIVEEQIWSSKGCITTSSSSSETYCQCNHLTNFALILDVYQSEINPFSLNVLSWVGCIISIAGLFMTIVSYAAFSKLREKRAPKILLILCINLMSTLIIFVAFVERTEPLVFCKVVALVIQFFILSTFFWMAVEGFNLYRMFVKVFSNSTNSRNFLLKSAVFAWGLPLIITIATAASKMDYFETKRENIHKICVLHGNQFYFGVLLPVCLVMAGNILVLTLVLRGIRKNSDLHKTCGCKKNLRAAFVCSLLLGVTWIFAVFAYRDAQEIFQWLFCIFNSFQGFFIFVNYTLQNKQVRDHWVLFIRKKWNLLTKKSENSQTKGSTIPFKTMNTLNEEIS